MTLPKTVDDVIARMREIDAALPADDGVAVFNRMYLTVTERIAAVIAEGKAPIFRDGVTMADLDVRFASLWLEAYDADAAARKVPTAWRPLFQSRSGRLPVQYAIAGMNTHIEHDLPLAVVRTCEAMGRNPDEVHGDYEAVSLAGRDDGDR